jgi:hypothetical protein
MQLKRHHEVKMSGNNSPHHRNNDSLLTTNILSTRQACSILEL